MLQLVCIYLLRSLTLLFWVCLRLPLSRLALTAETDRRKTSRETKAEQKTVQRSLAGRQPDCETRSVNKVSPSTELEGAGNYTKRQPKSRLNG